MINISAQEQEELINQFGPRALLSDFAARPNIQYVLRKIDGEIEERFGQDRFARPAKTCSRLSRCCLIVPGNL